MEPCPLLRSALSQPASPQDHGILHHVPMSLPRFFLAPLPAAENALVTLEPIHGQQHPEMAPHIRVRKILKADHEFIDQTNSGRKSAILDLAHNRHHCMIDQAIQQGFCVGGFDRFERVVPQCIRDDRALPGL